MNKLDREFEAMQTKMLAWGSKVKDRLWEDEGATSKKNKEKAEKVGQRHAVTEGEVEKLEKQLKERL